jgi:uncharacterized protein (TIGR02597 family)
MKINHLPLDARRFAPGRLLKITSVGAVQLLAGLALITPSVRAQTTASTDPVGAVALSVQGTGGTLTNALSFVALGMVQPTIYQGAVDSVSGSTLTQTASNWADNAFNGTGNACFVEITSGVKTGLRLDVVSTTASTHSLTLSGSVAALSAGDTFKVHKHWTLANVLGSTAATVAINPGTGSTADQVLVLNPATQLYTTYYFKNSGVGGTGWRSTGSTSVDTSNVPLYIDEGLLFSRKQSATVNLYLVGEAKTGATQIPVSSGLNIVSNVYAAGTVTLGNSGLYTGNSTTGLAGGTGSTADQLLTFNPATQLYTTYYFKTSGVGGTGWRSTASTSFDQTNAALVVGQSFIVNRKAAGTTAFTWTAAQPF